MSIRKVLQRVISPLRANVAEPQRKTFDELLLPNCIDAEANAFLQAVANNHARSNENAAHDSRRVRDLVRQAASLTGPPSGDSLEDSLCEFKALFLNRQLLRPAFQKLAGKRVLFSGQAYYYPWYLSRALRQHGWTADVLNWDIHAGSQIYYHGQDYRFTGDGPEDVAAALRFYLQAVYDYDVFHFSNAHGICFGFVLQTEIARRFGLYQEIFLLKDLGKRIVYTNNGCLDGVSQSSFASWGSSPVCGICRWRNEPAVCSDARNLAWGRFRNAVVDFQCLQGGNRIDFNDHPTVHEVPEVYCMSPDVWRPDLEVPDSFKLPGTATRLYHGVGQRAERSDDEGVNIKCTHIYRPLVDRLRADGYDVELLEPTDVPNRHIRFYQAQADVFIDMLTYGWFGATAKEGMMLGKPVVAYIRPEWLESVRLELPEYAAELPIVNATPETIEMVLRELLDQPAKRAEIGRRSRKFAMKWHSDEAGGKRFDRIYRGLLEGDLQLRTPAARSGH